MTPCPHLRITARYSVITPADEPPYMIGAATCDDCGRIFQLEDIPDGATVHDERGRLVEFLTKAEAE